MPERWKPPGPEEMREILDARRARLQEIEEKGAEALSDYDRKIAFGGNDELAVAGSIHLLTNQINYYEKKLEPYASQPQQTNFLEDI